LITMAFPYEPQKIQTGEIGNDINVVASFLKSKHLGRFMIWNISEESYNYSKFADQVLEYKFPGHPAPPLGLLFKICSSVESWLDADETNVAIIHCLTGKGRTAALMACVLTWLGEFLTPMEALQYIAERRALTVDQLTIPSQRRYVQYFSNMLDGVKPRSEPLLLRRVIMNTVPTFGSLSSETQQDSQQGCCPYIQLFKNGKLIATASAATESDPNSKSDGDNNKKQSKMQLRWINQVEGSASFAVDCPIQGDILLRCRHAAASGMRVSMFRAGFHTGYVPSGVLRLTKAQLDGSNGDPRYDEDFFIDLIFAPVSVVPTSDGESGSANDSGIIIDSISTDKYEASLHKDARFWESITTRKSRSKKRRSRKFVSAQQEQFSISDDASSGGKSPTDSNTSVVSFLSAQAALLQQQQKASSTVSGLSDMELILQLAQAEDPSESSLEPNSNVAIPPVTNTVVSNRFEELQALEDLEKELGLGELGLSSSGLVQVPGNNSTLVSSGDGKSTNTVVAKESPSSFDGGIAAVEVSVASTVPATPVVTVQEDDDNLDELEKYLQSLTN